MSDHAIENAKAWLQTVREMVARLDAAGTTLGDDGAEEARAEIEAAPLSVLIRDGWRTPGQAAGAAEEYEILLTTGGPALRIVGSLESDEPIDAALEWQDWGTPWTELSGLYLTNEDRDALLNFARVFYFGEC